MGKGDKRRLGKVPQEKWDAIFEPRQRGIKKTYKWCAECQALLDTEEWCEHLIYTPEQTRTYGFALMADCEPGLARLLQHDQMAFENTTMGESIEQMRKQNVERTASQSEG